MLEESFTQSCYLVAITRNRFGDRIYSSAGSAIPCRFRYIDTVERGAHSELYNSDAQIWLAPSVSVSVGSVILYDGTYYQVERLNKARRLGESEIQFKKCDLSVIQIGVS